MVRSNKVTNEMLHECRVTNVLWVIWDVEFDGDIHFFYVWPQEMSMSSQIRSN